MTEERNRFLADNLELIGHVAKDISRKYPTVDYDDIDQTIRLRTLEEYQYLRNQPDSYLRAVFRRFATKFCGQEVMEQTAFSGNFMYRIDDVRKMLEHAVSDPHKTFVPFELRKGSAKPSLIPTYLDEATGKYTEADLTEASTDWEAIDVSIDVKRGLLRLSTTDRTTLFCRFVLCDESTKDSNGRMKVHRALQKLTNAMNNNLYKGDN